jgi:hypothetical protein
MGSPTLHYRHLILLHTQMRDGYRRLPTVREWLAEFRPYAPRYQPRSGKRRVPTKPSAQKEIRVATNPFLSDEQKKAMHTQLTQISDEYAQMEQEEIRLHYQKDLIFRELHFYLVSTRTTRH